MWEMIERMASDRLWIYTALAGSIFGALFLAWIRDTRIALWVWGKWDMLLDTLRDRFGWTWFNQDPDAWRKVNPNIARKIDELEERLCKCAEMAHPPKDLDEFEQWGELDARIKKLEGKRNAKIN